MPAPTGGWAANTWNEHAWAANTWGAEPEEPEPPTEGEAEKDTRSRRVIAILSALRGAG